MAPEKWPNRQKIGVLWTQWLRALFLGTKAHRIVSKIVGQANAKREAAGAVNGRITAVPLVERFREQSIATAPIDVEADSS